MFYIYILHSESYDKYYVGSSEDAHHRLLQHNDPKNPTFTSKYGPWKIVALFEVGPQRGMALKLERFIKQQKSRRLIEKLVDPAFKLSGELAQLVRVPHVRD